MHKRILASVLLAVILLAVVVVHGSVAQVPAGRKALFVRTFVDWTCNNSFQPGLDKPVAGIDLALRFDPQTDLLKAGNFYGLAGFYGWDFPASGVVTLTAGMPPNDMFRGIVVAPCNDRQLERTLTDDDFSWNRDTEYVRYKLVGTPTPTPGP